MWAIRSHTLNPLPKLSNSKVKFKCTEVKLKGFEEIKKTLARNTLLAYLYLNKRFETHTNNNNIQLGLFISQEGNLLLSKLEK